MKKIFAAAALFFAGSTFIHAQSFEATLEKLATSYQPEKTYLQFDKPAYAAGETIWFKAYLMEGLFPADGSKTFYVDWIADNGNVLSHTVSPVVEGGTNGQFDIPETYNGNAIHVRAYTKWMLNFDTAFLYTKDIRLLSKNTVLNKGQKPAVIASLQFFPESGDAIAGISNRIAFKANDQWGRPVKIKGIVTASNGDVVDTLRTLHDGMGSFYMIPASGEKYTAKWQDERGADHTTVLPVAKDAGYIMQVKLNGTRRMVDIMGGGNLSDDMKHLVMIGTINQKMAFKTDVVLGANNSARKTIPTENLPSGILTITLLSDAMRPLAERITFIKNDDYAFPSSFEVKRWGLNKRARNEIKIIVPDSMQHANLSIAVTDASIEKDTTDNIISHLLLAADLKGDVYHPAYYFSANTDAVAQNLDLLMLTNGWRRFKWEDVATGRLPLIQYPKDTNYLTLSGKVFGVSKSQLTGTESIVLLIKGRDSAIKMDIMPIERDGTFSDPNFILLDTISVYYKLKSKLFSNAEAKFMTSRLPNPDYAQWSKGFMPANLYADTTGNYKHFALAAEALRLTEAQRGKVLETVTVKTKTKTPVQLLEEKYTSGLFRGGDGYQFDIMNEPAANAYPDVLTFLQGRVAGLQVSNSNGVPTLSWRGQTPTIFLDEIQMETETVTTIPVSDIAYVKVLRPPFYGATGGGAGGAIAIYTKKGSDLRSSGTGLTTNRVVAYAPIREFYSPNYDRFDPRNEATDIRTTLYWNPQVNVGKKKEVVLSFYNNDASKSFRVVIEGMSSDGLLTHYEQVME